MKKQYTKKQIQEAISYWQNKLNESSSGINPVTKFFSVLQTAMQKHQAVLFGVSEKTGKTRVIAQWEYENNKLTLYTNSAYLTNSQSCLTAKDLIEGLLKKGVKASQIEDIVVSNTRDESHYAKLSDVTVKKITSKIYGQGIVIILAANADDQGMTDIDSFFN